MVTPKLAMFIALLSGAISHLAFAPYDFWLLLPLSVTVLLALTQHASPRQAAWLGLGYGFGQFALGLRWVHVSIDQFGGLPLVFSLLLMALLCLYLACYPALTLWLLNRFFTTTLSRTLAFPALWLLTEWARGWVLTGFPWLWAGYSQLDGPFTVLVPFIGVLGVGLLLNLAAAAFWPLLQGRWHYISAFIFMFISVTAAELFAPKPSQHGQLDVALIQGNIEQSLKWQPETLLPTMLKYQQMSQPHFDADLIIWPEAAIPAPEVMIGEYLAQIETEIFAANTHLITGIIGYSQDNNRFYNSLLTLGSEPHNGQFSPFDPTRYNKHHLLPIGEFVPFEDLLRPIAPLFNLPMSSFSRGDYIQPNLTTGTHQLTSAICYEIAFPELVRANVNEQTDLLLTVSNDAWFGNSIGPHQHMAIAQMRALELGRPLLRVTNNGITAIVGIDGQIQSSIPQFEDGILRDIVELKRVTTPFSQYGQAPLYVIAMALLLLAYRLRF